MTDYREAGTLAVAVCALAASMSPALAAGVQLVPHRAVYAVALDEASDRSGINDMRGRIVYEFRGSACAGYTTNFRFVTQIASRAGARVTDQQTTTFEEGDGSLFRFVTRTFVDQEPDRTIEGTAERTDDATLVTLTEPEDAAFELDPAAFPTAHMIDLIERADAGERFYEKKIYDGSDDADKVMTTTVIIGPEKTEEAEDRDALDPIADSPFRNVSVAYFDELAQGEGEGLPDYRIAFKMHDNGITRSLEMDYGDFSLTGTMEELELFELEECD
ncbi:cell envelope integrity EipB family protein [Roseitalea porphyridii]|uniref:DUF1849 family protein n=1 Tax=Roseitalea porphyridii TaxID=1852022 RepID=A0A4P6V257_9HYPH|nr:cell envelope integrity EipB family protein [Roseitalea porphyridii]QBK30666.1 DUF1849 family protein [Roseitalea porphyridii]